MHVSTVLRFEPSRGHGSSLSQSLVLHELCPRKSLVYRALATQRDRYATSTSCGSESAIPGPVAAFDSSQSHASFVQIYLNIREDKWWIFAGEEGLSNTKREGFNSKIRLMNRGRHGRQSPAAVIAIVRPPEPQLDRAPPIHGKVMGTQEFQPVTLRAHRYLLRHPPDDPLDESPHWMNPRSTWEPIMMEPTVVHTGQSFWAIREGKK